jgi:hypothetical protein
VQSSLPNAEATPKSACLEEARLSFQLPTYGWPRHHATLAARQEPGPVADLNASKAFYTALGFVNNPQFTDDTAAFMVWSESINAMLLTHAKWRAFTTRPIPPNTSSEVGLNVSCDSREDVDAMNKSAFENGGTGSRLR